MSADLLSSSEILEAACNILGQKPAKPVDHRGWVHFWCPFHGDALQRGSSKEPNLGVNVDIGNWKCLRCGEKGGSLFKLAEKLGKDYTPRAVPADYKPKKRYTSKVDRIDEALITARSSFLGSPAMHYVLGRGLTQYTAAVYGLGYGTKAPYVTWDTTRLARESGLVIRDGRWLWAGSVVYADPPSRPTVLNVRYIPDEKLPEEEQRDFEIKANHHTWGDRVQPLGAWRAAPETSLVVLVEGLFDMLIMAQHLEHWGLFPGAIAAYTNGAAPSEKMLAWISAHPYQYLLLPDPDGAGQSWTETVAEAVRRGDGRLTVAHPPDKLDPDEALLAGWRPPCL